MDCGLKVRGTYNPSLRDRSIWKIIEPVLTASPGSIKEERVSQTSDFTFQQENSTLSLQLLLLSPSSLEEDNEKQNTGLRLRHFAASDPMMHSRKAIAFLLSEEAFTSASGKYSLNGLLTLQALMFESLTNPLPVISIPDAPSFFPSIHDYISNLHRIPIASPSLSDSVALLAHATSDHSTLCEQNSNILSDLFPSFTALSEATRTREGRGLLEDYLGEGTAQSVIGFWQEDVARE
ncbi:hypothetical protein BDW62DRAFT_185590 [Aspergillus aurantiobrunneus]